MEELECLKKKIKRLENVIAFNRKQIKALRPILNNIAKQIGCNSSDIKKIIQTLYENFDVEMEDNKSPPINEDCVGSFI